MENGPFKSAVDAEKQGILKEEYTTYKVANGYLEKTVTTRNHKTVASDYHDTTSTERLVKVNEV